VRTRACIYFLISTELFYNGFFVWNRDTTITSIAFVCNILKNNKIPEKIVNRIKIKINTIIRNLNKKVYHVPLHSIWFGLSFSSWYGIVIQLL